jgi:hypothetical protein
MVDVQEEEGTQSVLIAPPGMQRNRRAGWSPQKEVVDGYTTGRKTACAIYTRPSAPANFAMILPGKWTGRLGGQHSVREWKGVRRCKQ